jgi:cyclophilin family peptidyl-prolyl cis-trans isomerase
MRINPYQDASFANQPPTAADLNRFTQGIVGKGQLIASIHTDKGVFKCELFEQDAPIAVANFVGLARGLKAWIDPKTEQPQVNTPYYDGIVFHRVIPRFMIQTGDPLGVGSGGPGYKFANETTPKRLHKPGTLSMANAGPGTNGGQFFINEIKTPHLDGKFSVFGQCDDVALVKTIALAGNQKSELKSISFARQH